MSKKQKIESIEALAKLLDEINLDFYFYPKSLSAFNWNIYRKKIAENLLKKIEIYLKE